jgi:hypothetical protein
VNLQNPTHARIGFEALSTDQTPKGARVEVSCRRPVASKAKTDPEG